MCGMLDSEKTQCQYDHCSTKLRSQRGRFFTTVHPFQHSLCLTVRPNRGDEEEASDVGVQTRVRTCSSVGITKRGQALVRAAVLPPRCTLCSCASRRQVFSVTISRANSPMPLVYFEPSHCSSTTFAMQLAREMIIAINPANNGKQYN